MQGVHFSMPLMIDDYTLSVPLRKNPNLKGMLNIFQYQIWFILLAVVPLYFMTMCLADCIYYGKVNWQKLGGFVLRTVMIEVKNPLPDNSKLYQKQLIIFWTVPMFILAAAYAGNMTAMIAKPSLEKPIKDAEDLVYHKKMSVALVDGDVGEPYFRTASPGTVMNKMFEMVDIWTASDCYQARNLPFWKSGKYAMACAGLSVMSLMSYDYSRTGLCNYYKTPDMFFRMDLAFAFQVCFFMCRNHIVYS